MKNLATYHEERQRAIMTFVKHAGTLQRLADYEDDAMLILDIKDALRSLEQVTRFYRAAGTLHKGGLLDNEGHLASHKQTEKDGKHYPVLYFNREGRTLCPACANSRGNDEDHYHEESPATHAELCRATMLYDCWSCGKGKRAEVLP